MNETILEKLRPITAEEQRFLQGEQEVEQSIYSSGSRFVVDAQKLLKKGNFLEIRPHTCFVHFPPHLHNYVEMVYMREGETIHIINHTDRIIPAAFFTANSEKNTNAVRGYTKREDTDRLWKRKRKAVVVSLVYAKKIQSEQRQQQLDAFCSTIESMNQISGNYL